MLKRATQEKESAKPIPLRQQPVLYVREQFAAILRAFAADVGMRAFAWRGGWQRLIRSWVAQLSADEERLARLGAGDQALVRRLAASPPLFLKLFGSVSTSNAGGFLPVQFGPQLVLYPVKGAEELPLLRDFAQLATLDMVGAAGGVRRALARFGRELAAGKEYELSPAGREQLAKMLDARVVETGILVAGPCGIVRIEDNVVSDAAHGISAAADNSRLAELFVSRNVIRNFAPSDTGVYGMGLFVGNCDVAFVTGTSASLDSDGQPYWISFEAVTVVGSGSVLVMRDASLRGYTSGVSVGEGVIVQPPTPVLRVAQDTFFAALGDPSAAVAGDVTQERCSPPWPWS
jgi:hypothetical protein